MNPTEHLKAHRDKIAAEKAAGTYVAPKRVVMAYGKAVAAKCRDCIVDPADVGSPLQQIACCTASDCALHSVRPVKCSKIPRKLLASYGISEEKLCERAKILVVDAVSSSESNNGEGIQEPEGES